jgi:KUP system potassium uptake protein
MIKKVLQELSTDLTIPKYATHLYDQCRSWMKLKKKVLYSIFCQKRPKRADIYWFIHVNILNELQNGVQSYRKL